MDWNIAVFLSWFEPSQSRVWCKCKDSQKRKDRGGYVWVFSRPYHSNDPLETRTQWCEAHNFDVVIFLGGKTATNFGRHTASMDLFSKYRGVKSCVVISSNSGEEDVLYTPTQWSTLGSNLHMARLPCPGHVSVSMHFQQGRERSYLDSDFLFQKDFVVENFWSLRGNEWSLRTLYSAKKRHGWHHADFRAQRNRAHSMRNSIIRRYPGVREHSFVRCRSLKGL